MIQGYMPLAWYPFAAFACVYGGAARALDAAASNGVPALHDARLALGLRSNNVPLLSSHACRDLYASSPNAAELTKRRARWIRRIQGHAHGLAGDEAMRRSSILGALARAFKQHVTQFTPHIFSQNLGLSGIRRPSEETSTTPVHSLKLAISAMGCGFERGRRGYDGEFGAESWGLMRRRIHAVHATERIWRGVRGFIGLGYATEGIRRGVVVFTGCVRRFAGAVTRQSGAELWGFGLQLPALLTWHGAFGIHGWMGRNCSIAPTFARRGGSTGYGQRGPAARRGRRRTRSTRHGAARATKEVSKERKGRPSDAPTVRGLNAREQRASQPALIHADCFRLHFSRTTAARECPRGEGARPEDTGDHREQG
ncbi:hypothetical protein B0H17DRAFT_1141412 [Mycena rosella]|uniref:Uncharacterized protein n=1 Tax=Mycena rosella TaxID=1033263 RepID=A0AAD7G937_MYCRO|nr:hypothetical protein B0H17DRAFT_1141412 [Mycena rosella]